VALKVDLDDSRMSEQVIRYDLLACEALRGIVRTVLQRVHKKGLPGDHHFLITFDTTASGTIISKRLKDQYPEEMIIVIQHQFWDLLVYDDRFEVKLSFNNVPERLVIPYAAIKSFVDPSVPFAFSPNLIAPAPEKIVASDDKVLDKGEIHEASGVEGRGPVSLNKNEPLPERSAEPKAEEPADEKQDLGQQMGEVVELDLFRKK
jgi:hypothetical protein